MSNFFFFNFNEIFLISLSLILYFFKIFSTVSLFLITYSISSYGLFILDIKKPAKFENSLVLVISFKLFVFSLFFLLIKLDEIKKTPEKKIINEIKKIRVEVFYLKGFWTNY